jgi:hypothetical protein
MNELRVLHLIPREHSSVCGVDFWDGDTETD